MNAITQAGRLTCTGPYVPNVSQVSLVSDFGQRWELTGVYIDLSDWVNKGILVDVTGEETSFAPPTIAVQTIHTNP